MGTNDIYLNTSEFLSFSGMTLRTFRRKIKRGHFVPVKREGKNFFIYTELPTMAAQEAFLKERGIGQKKEQSPEHPSIYNLSPSQKKVADEREAIVKGYLAVYKDVPRKKKTEFQEQYAKSKGISRRTLNAWISLYKDGGYYALVPNWNNGTRERIITPEIAKFIERSYLIELGPPLKKVWEDSVRLLGGKYPNHPSYRTFVNYIHSKWTASQQFLVRDPEAWNRKYSPYVRRDWDMVEVNEVWVGDGKQVDVCCLYRGKPIFPWISAFMDAKSRKFVGWTVTPTHNSLSIGQAFVYGVRQYGPPKTVILDQGKSEKSKYISGEKVKKGAEVKLFEGIDQTLIPGILRDIGSEIFLASPWNAREKTIEPNFGIYTDRLRPLPGYRGHNVKVRPKKLAREIKTGNLLSFEELSSYLDNFNEERNNRVHSTTKKTPNSFYEGFIPKIPSQAMLDYLLMDVRRCRVKDSSILIEGHLYRGEELWRLAGEDVEVRRDPKDVTRAVIIYKGEIFGTAREEMPDHYRGPVTLESRKTAQRIRKQISNFRKEVNKGENIIDDPLRMEIKIEQEGTPRKRDIRPAPNLKVIPLHKKESLARKVSKVLSQPDPEAMEEVRVAVGAGKDIFSRLAASLRPVSKEDGVPIPRYIKKLSFRETDEDSF